MSTPWMFSFVGFSAIFNLDIHLRDPLRSWRFPFSLSMSPKFLEGVPKLSENFQLFSHELDDMSHPISLGISNIVSGSYIYPIIFRQSHGYLSCPKRFAVFSGLQNSLRYCWGNLINLVWKCSCWIILLGIQVWNLMLRGSLRGVLTKNPHMLKW